MRRVLLASVFMLLFQTVRASECGNGLPCGSIPWPLPAPPQLASPTPMPTVGVTTNPPTQTPGGATATPAPTQAGGINIDTSGINNQFATLQVMANATSPAIIVSGTPISPSEQLTSLTQNTSTFFGYLRGVSEINLGGLTPLIAFVTLSFVTVLSVKIITLLLPVLAVLFGFLRKIISVVLDFLPF